MSSTIADDLKMDLDEKFPHLSRAPIVEAVVNIRCRATTAWEEPVVSARILEDLPEYSLADSQREEMVQIRMQEGPETIFQDIGFSGVRCSTPDHRQIAQFHRDSFLFSRLAPYEDWLHFLKEALRLWLVFVELARPADVQRIGLRFINRMEITEPQFEHEDFFVDALAPQPPKNLELPFSGFLHQDILMVPGHPYGINTTRTVQPALSPAQLAGIILDIDVFTTIPSPLDHELIERRLNEMRWLKNKVFFGTISAKALEAWK